MKFIIPILVAAGMLAGPAHADWQPNGPIKFWIGFGAGGGTDTQARTLAGEIEALKGWRIIPENKAGGGGTVMAAQLKDAPVDGHTVGLAINTTFDFATLKNENISIDDFTYLTTTASSQTGILARADSGWKTLEDMAAAARGGTRIVWSNWGALVEAGSGVVADKLGIEVNHLRMKGGKATLNALVAKDANVAWGGGVQRGLVAAGEVVILASAEPKPLVQAPDGKTLKDYGIDHYFGFMFMLAGPKGMDPAAARAITAAVQEVLQNPESKTAKFIAKQYPPAPVLISGGALDEMLRKNHAANMALLK
jgi:tripartite-type tricarboxylate transporter receptor subunit TctC